MFDNLVKSCKYFYLLLKSLILFIIDFVKWFIIGFGLSFFSLFKFFFIGLYIVITLIPKYFIYGVKVILKKEKKKELFGKFIFFLSLTVYLICVFLLSRWATQNVRLQFMAKDIANTTDIIDKMPLENVTKPEEDNSNITDDTNIPSDEDKDNNKVIYTPYDYEHYFNVSYLSVDFNSLIKQNSDTVGWIRINNTNINHPFVQTTDNNYYLKHSFDKKKNKYGWIFGDYRNNMNNMRVNTILYGHNLTSKNLFGSLPNLLKKSWYTNPDNLIIKMSTPNDSMLWKIFSIYKIEPEAYYLRTVFEEDEHLEFLKTIKERSIYDFGDILTVNDKILTLSTCDNGGKMRIVVHARLVGKN